MRNGLHPFINYTRIYKTDENHHGIQVTIMHRDTNDSVIHIRSNPRVRGMIRWAISRLREQRADLDNQELVASDVRTCGGDTQITLLFD